MGPESVSTVVESSTMQSVPDLIPSSSSLVPATCGINPEITSDAGKIVPGDFQQGDGQLSTVNSRMGNADSKDILAVKAKDSGEPENSTINVLPDVSTNPNSAEDDVNDVKVCDICGDVGYEEALVTCSECNEGAEHIYCMQIHLDAVPEGDWFCDTCKLKHKANEQKKAGIESHVQDFKSPSLSRSTGKQGNDGDIVSMSLTSAKLKTPSEKVKTHKPLQSSFPCKRQIEDSSGAPDSKKQAIERGNEVVNAPGPSLQRDNSFKAQETANADFHGAFPRIRISVRPPCTRDGSLNTLEAAKSESVSMTAPVFNNSMQRSLSRENSFKNVETAKVKFLPSTSSVGPSSGIALRASGKPTGVDGKSGLVSSRTGLGNSGLSSSRRSTISMTDSAGGSANRSGGQPPFRQVPANTPLKRVGLSKSGDTLPSFLLSTRPGNSSRGHLASRGSKEIRSGNGQVVGQPSEPSTPTGQNLKMRKTPSCSHADLKQWKDNPISSPGNAEMKVIKGPCAAECPVGNSLGEKPNGHHNSMPSISTAENCRSDKTVALVKEDLMDLAMQREDRTMGSMVREDTLTKDTLSKEAMTRSFQEDNSLQSQESKMLKFDGENDIILSQKASSNAVLMETSSGVAKSSLSASAMKIISSETSNFVASSSLLDTPVQCAALPSNTKCYRCKEFGHSAQVCSKSPSFSKDIVRLTSSRCNIPATVIDNVNKCNASETNQISLGKVSVVQCLSNAAPGCSSALHDNVLSAGLKSTIEAFNNSSNVVAASQTTAKPLNCYADRVPSSAAGALQTSVVAEIAHGSNSSSIQRKLISETMDRGTSDLNPCTLSETTVKSANGYWSNETTPIAGAFCTEQSVMAQMGNQALDRRERPNLSVNLTSTTKITVGASQQCILSQKLPTLPESQFLWRGGFEIIDKVCCHHFYDGMQAYPSNRASPKVYEVSRKFPSQLHLEQVQRCDAWPKRFQESPPTDQDIALYIFPVEIERCQMPYMKLLEDTIKHDLAMRVNLENAELLIFSSNQLPENYHRFNGRMYLWGVFRGGKQIPLVQNAKEASPFATDVGPNALQDGPSAFSSRHVEGPLSRQLPCTDISEANRGEEDMDIDMEGGREIEMSDRAATRPESEQVSVSASHTAEPSYPLDSKPILSCCESGNSGGPFEQVGPSLVASRAGHFGALDDADEHTRPCGSNKELDFPPGFAPPPGFCHSLAKSSNNFGKSLPLVPENASLFQFHTRPQEKESLPAALPLKTGREFTDKSLSPAFKSQGPNCPPGIGLEHLYSPPSFEHEPARKPPLLSSDHSLEHLTANNMVGKHDLETAQNEMGPTSQHSVHLLSRNESSRSHAKTDHSYGSRGLSRSRSLTPIRRATDRTGGTAQMYKSRSFREQPSFTRINSRRMEEKREWGADSSREKEDKREGGRHSSEEKEDKGKSRNNSLEMEDNRGKPRNNNSMERKDKRERARNSSRGKEEERERSRNCREKEDRERGREYTERDKKEMGRDTGSHRHRSRYSGIQRHKDSGKHYHTSSDCHSHSQSPTLSYSSSRGKCRSHGAGNLMPHHQVNSSDTVSSDRHFRNKRPSLERDSECEEKFEITSFLYKGKAQMDGDYGGSCKQEKSSGKRMEPQLRSPEVEDQCEIIRSRGTPEDQDEKTKHQWSFTALHDLNDDAVDLKISEALNATSLVQYPDQKYSSEIAPQEPLQPIASDLMNLRPDLVSNSGIGEQSLILEDDWCAGSKFAGSKSVTCLQLFPVEERDCGEGEFIANDCDFNLELQLGRQTSNKLPLSLLDRPSAKMRSCNFMVKQGACPSRSRVVCEDSKEMDPSDLASILSLSMPQYRKEGNTWVEVAEDREMLDEQDIDVKLTL